MKNLNLLVFASLAFSQRFQIFQRSIAVYKSEMFRTSVKKVYRFINCRHSTTISKAGECNIHVRFALCLDGKFPLEKFVSVPADLSISSLSSAHFIAKLVEKYNHRPYNYNDVGEFELVFAPACFVDEISPTSSTPSQRVLTFPDSIMAETKSATASSFGALYNQLNKTSLLRPEDLSTDFQTNASPEKVILVNLSKEHPWSRAQETISWLKEATKSLSKPTPILLTRDFVNSHAVGKWDILLLPSGERISNLLSSEEVNKFVNKYLRE